MRDRGAPWFVDLHHTSSLAIRALPIESACPLRFPFLPDTLDALARYADRAAPLGEEAAAEQVAVEYTRLFVGPPSPAAPPWETFYRSEGVTVGFGEATFRMRELLRAVGLEVRNDNNQYEDHLGIELLYLSVLCARVFVGDDESVGRARCAQVAGDGPVGSEQVREFIEEHPLNWVGAFRDRVAETFPEGYFCHVLTLAERILAWQRASAIG